MSENLDNLKKQYEKLGKEIEALENQPDEPCYKPGVLVHYSDYEINESSRRIGIFRSRCGRQHKVGANVPWKHIAPAPMPWIVWEGGTNPPVHPDQEVEVWLRERDTPNAVKACAKKWNWRHGISEEAPAFRRQIVAYRVVTTEEEA
jgi:hypothetical protein